LGTPWSSIKTMPTLFARLRHVMFHALFLVIRPMTLGAQVAVFNGKGEVLLIKTSYVAGWQFPGGGVDSGETIEAAAIRELAEEAGQVPAGPLRLVGVYKNTKASPRDHVVLFACDDAAPIDGFNVDGREIIACGFFPTDALPADLTGPTRRRLEEILAGTRPDPFW
jgi:ADP-ribose pyrophosphatase YjhB (NUDIX family)